MSEALEESVDERQVRPIACPDVVTARNEFVLEGYRQSQNLNQTNNICRLDAFHAPVVNSQARRVQEQQQLERPNLQVPVGDPDVPDYVYLAQ